MAGALARGDACTARARAERLAEATIAAINAGEVPPALQERALAEAQALAGEIACASGAPLDGLERRARGLAGWLRRHG